MFGKKHKQSSTEKMSKSGKGKHSQPKTPKFKEHMRSLYRGKTYEERFGVEYAAIIKEKQKKPKIECIYCGKLASKSNITRWHNNNCKLCPK